jgi:putative membrane protein
MYFFPESLQIEGGMVAFIIPGIIFGLLDSVLKPLMRLLSLPLIFLSAGLFSIVINAGILFLLEYFMQIFSAFGVSFLVLGGVFNYLGTGFILSVINYFVRWLLKKA